MLQRAFWILNSSPCAQIMPLIQLNMNCAPLLIRLTPPSSISQLIKSIVILTLTLPKKLRNSLRPSKQTSFSRLTRKIVISLLTLTLTPWEVMILRRCGSLKTALTWPDMKFLCRLYIGLLSYLFWPSSFMPFVMDAAVANAPAATLLRVSSQSETAKSHEWLITEI